MQKYQLFIGGESLDSQSSDWIESYNPYTGEPWAQVPRGNAHDAKLAVDAAENAFPGWAQTSATERGKLLRKLADLLAEKAEDLARIEVRDNGKLFAEMHAQCKALPLWYHYFAGLADKIEGEVLPVGKPDLFAYTQYEPLGIIAAIIPWNSPLMLIAWKCAPALAAGNTVVIKPSEFASASSLEFAKCVAEAGFPPGVVNVVTGYGAEVGEPLVADPRIAKVTFTGGETGGKHVYQTAAKGLKYATLELGGKSPNIVFEDAEIDNAVKGAISGIFSATGQTCIAGSRLLVHESIYDQFVSKLVGLAKKAKMGDPQSLETQVGPITTRPQYEKVLNYIDIAQAEGARCVLGGKPADINGGWFIEPTIFTHVYNNMRIAQEEVFGPILSVIKFADEKEAIEIANDTPYGLAAGVWTQDIRRAMRLTKALQAGTVWVNTYRAFSPLAPFGGYKQSGIGRESGQKAMYEFLQSKTVWISSASEVPDPFVMKL